MPAGEHAVADPVEDLTVSQHTSAGSFGNVSCFPACFLSFCSGIPLADMESWEKREVSACRAEHATRPPQTTLVNIVARCACTGTQLFQLTGKRGAAPQFSVHSTAAWREGGSGRSVGASAPKALGTSWRSCWRALVDRVEPQRLVELLGRLEEFRLE